MRLAPCKPGVRRLVADDAKQHPESTVGTAKQVSGLRAGPPVRRPRTVNDAPAAWFRGRSALQPGRQAAAARSEPSGPAG